MGRPAELGFASRVRRGVHTLRWLIANGFCTPGHLRSAIRFGLARLRWPHVEFDGFCFLGRGVELSVRPGHGRLRIGAWTHIGDRVKIRAHEGNVTIGAKCVLGYDLTLNAYLDVEIGAATIVGDRVYVCDFDHRTDDVTVPIKDQGLVKGPVRIGADCWLGSHVVVVRGTELGPGCVAAAGAVVRGEYPPGSIIAGVPGRVVADREGRYADGADVRAYLDALGREAERRVRALIEGRDG